MKNPRAALVAVAIPLLLTSLPLTAGELPFNAPGTERAKESAPLLRQAAGALNDVRSAAMLGLRDGQQISNLWLFPTADANTVFARYNLTSAEEGTSGAEHLTVLTVRDNRIVESQELTSANGELLSKRSARLDRSAVIGTGHAAQEDDVTNTSHGVPASPHWTAGIGTGAAASSPSVRETQQPASSGSQPVAAVAHWTSRIGRGDAVDSNEPVVKASLVDAR